MKILKSLSMILLLANVALAQPQRSLVPVSHIYSPEGFDSNDNVEIIIEGFLPNLCYRSPSHSVEVKDNLINIKVEALNHQQEGVACAEMIVPFLEKVELGVIDKGDYKILVNGKSPWEQKGSIKVSESISDAIDESVYANVNYIEKDDRSRVVKLKGYNPSDCFVLDRIDIVNNKKDVHSILPQMKQISDFCPMKMVPFEYELEVPENLKSDKVLLHVRVMDGKSVNSLFNNQQ